MLPTERKGLAGGGTNLGVSDQHQLSVWARVVKVVDCRGRGVGTVHDGVRIADAATGSLTTARRVDNSLGCGSGMGLDDQVYNSGGRAISLTHCRFTGAEDVNPGALPLHNGLAIYRAASGKEGLAQQKGKCVFD